MTIIELKQYLITAHKRDRKLTLIGFLIVAIIIAALVALQIIYKPIHLPDFKTITENFEQNGEKSFNYLKIIIPVVLLSMLTYPSIIVYKIAKRLGTIETFIESVEKGAIANTIDQSTVFKIKIPLLKIDFKFCPVEYVNINLTDDGSKMYNLPIPISVIQETKALLSGSNMDNIRKSWMDLYGDESEQNQTETVQLKSKEAFKSFLDEELLTELTSLDNERADSKKKYILFLIPGILIAVGWMVLQYLMTNEILKISTKTLVIGFVAVFAIFYAVIFFVAMKGRSNKMGGGDMGHKFKMRIFKRMVEFINPNFLYILHGHLSLPEVLATGIFESTHYDVKGNDQIIGKHNGVPFQLCDLTLQNQRNFTNEKEGPDEVFKGQAFIAKFNKSIKHELYLVPRKSSKLARRKNDIKDYLDFKGEKIILEDPEFMDLYDVYGSDQIEARYILSPALMERIKLLAKQHPGTLFFSFKADRISIFNNNQTNNFETNMFQSLVANDLMLKFYSELVAQMEFIDQLKLNVKIWK